MKATIAIASAAVLCGAASGQSVYMIASNAVQEGSDTVVTLDVVLNANNYSGSFYAWHQYNFNIGVTASGVSSGIADAIDASESPFQLAVTESPLGTFEPTLNAPARAWSTGRRPGAFFPGNGSTAGGNQFGPGSADLVSDSLISSTAGSIGGRQAADANGVPETNGFIHIGRVYEAFRFEFRYHPRMNVVRFTPQDVILNVYTGQGAANEFITPSFTDGFVIFPAPGAASALALAGVAASRRRR